MKNKIIISSGFMLSITAFMCFYDSLPEKNSFPNNMSNVTDREENISINESNLPVSNIEVKECVDDNIECRKARSKREFDILKERLEVVRKNEADRARKRSEYNIKVDASEKNEEKKEYYYFSNNTLSIIDMPLVDIDGSEFSDYMENDYQIEYTNIVDRNFKPLNYLVYDSTDFNGGDIYNAIFKDYDSAININVPILYEHIDGKEFNEFKECNIRQAGYLRCNNASVILQENNKIKFKLRGWPSYQVHMIIGSSGDLLFYDERMANGEFPETEVIFDFGEDL